MSIEEAKVTTLPPPKPRRAETVPGSRRWPWGVFVLLLIVAAIAYGGHRWGTGFVSKTFGPAKPPATQPVRVVPVMATAARRGDLPLYLNGPGTVTAFNTVTVRTRIDGQLIKVNFTEGQDVREGALLAEIDPRPYQVQLEQAEGQLAKDQAVLSNAKADLARLQEAGEAVSRQQLDTAAASVAQSEGVLKSDQAQINNAKLNLTYCRITAPLSGRIGLRCVDQGNMVHASDPNGLAVITQLQPIVVVFSLPQDDLPQVLRASSNGETVIAEAYNRDLRTKLATGSLLAIDNQIDTNSATVRFKAKFDNRDSMLYPNQFVNMRLLVETRKNAILIPAVAVQRSPTSTFVYVVRPDDTVEIRPVKPGFIEGDLTFVEGNLEVNERVVTDGVDKLLPGMKVAVRTPESSRASTTRPSSRPSSARPGGLRPATARETSRAPMSTESN